MNPHAPKVHLICDKCKSTEMNFVIRDPCPDDPLNFISIQCAQCAELTGIDEWSQFNKRELFDFRKDKASAN